MKLNCRKTNPSLIMIGVLIMLFFLEVGCSNNPPDPPDLTLTYDVVSKDPAKYKGKRVKWYGQPTGGGTFAKKGIGSSFKNQPFVDSTFGPGVPIKAFSASGVSEKEQVSLMFDLMEMGQSGKSIWVTGTVNGTDKLYVRINDSRYQEEIKVLVLSNAQLELPPGSPVKK